MEEILRMEHITKKFGEFYANKDINLSVLKGEVHTLLGENGAGKSTLMNILFGLYQPTAGQIYLHGKPVHIDSPATAVKLGIGMVHQHFMLVEAMTVFENIILGDRKTKGIFIDRDARKKEILELSQRYGLDVELDKQITEIAVGAQQRVEILKALYRGAELLVLDEPTAALTDIEVEGLFKIMNKLTEEGKSIIFISHKMREVLHISNRITILRTGETVCTLNRGETTGEELANLMIGRELTPSQYTKVTEPEAPVIALHAVDYHKTSKHNGLNGVSLQVGRGEILGIAGVDGNGQSQLAQLVTGVIAPEGGSVDMNPQRLHFGERVPHPRGSEQDGPGGQHVRHGEHRSQRDRRSPILRRQGMASEKAVHAGLRRTDAAEVRHPLPIRDAGIPEPVRRQPAEGHIGKGARKRAGPAGGGPPHQGP